MSAIRIKFIKGNQLKYISHLDLMRTMIRLFKRADLKVKYTQGFNPHPKLVFASPLSLGIESVCELLDVEFTEISNTDLVMEKFNNSAPAGMKALEVYESEKPFKNIAYAVYNLTLPCEYKDMFDKFLSMENIFIEKKNKKGEITCIDIKPQIQAKELGNCSYSVVLPCSNNNSININLLIKSFRNYADNFNIECNTVREMFYNENMEIFQ